MKRGIVLLGIVVAVILGASLSNEILAQKDWERLGSRKVDFGIEKDVIPVGIKDGTYKSLKFVVTGGSVNMRKVVVTYGNGTKDEIEVRHNFKRGSLSREIDLKGGKRVIRNITFWYDSDNRSRRRATLSVFGR